MYIYLIFLAISFIASVIGAICGIGGGVLIKPTLDAFGVLDVAAISFLSSCTVLAMSCCSVFSSLKKGGGSIDLAVSTPLGIGAALGGIAGKQVFQMLSDFFPDPNQVGAVQSVCLFLVALSLLLYTLNKARIVTKRIQGKTICVVIGFALGFCSSFLGIGGGPIDLMVLFYFFSMETKTAAANSLYVILISQTAALLQTIVTNNVPDVALGLIVLMVCGGMLGGTFGRRLNKKMDTAAVDRLFVGVMSLIMVICIYNLFQYM